MKIAVTIVRVLMGLLFLFGSITYLFHLMTPPPQTGAIKAMMDGFEASGYLMTMVKVVELTCGILFVSGFFVPLATVLISPIIVNIFMVHLMLEPSGLPVAIFLVAANAFIAYYHRESYRGLFKVH